MRAASVRVAQHKYSSSQLSSWHNVLAAEQKLALASAGCLLSSVLRPLATLNCHLKIATGPRRPMKAPKSNKTCANEPSCHGARGLPF